MEQEAREAATVSRNQNVVYVMPHDWASIAQFLGPLLDRVDGESQEIQLVVVTPDAEIAGAVSASAVKLLEGRALSVLAATSGSRAARLARIRPPQVLAGSASTLLELVRAAAIKADAVRAVCIAWADELIARDESASLESVMAALPKDAARVIVTAEATPEVEALVERYARRARRVAAAAGEAKPMPIEYVTVSANSRLSALRRLLDDADPKSATVFVRDRDRLNEVNDLLRSAGHAEGDSVRVGVSAGPDEDLVVLFDLPASREELHEAAGAARRAVALIQPRQLASLRTLAGGGAVTPRALPESSQRARDVDARARVELRRVLQENRFGRALLAIEPLLDEYDGAEIAAAALVLLEREREAAKSAPASTSASTSASPAPRREGGTMVRLFVSVGARDGVRPADLVGAMANQGGVSSAELGKVDIRESHSIVEASTTVADTLIERVTGTTIKGRRAIVRRDEGTDRGGDRPRGPARGGPRGDRGGDRGDRGGDRPRGGARGAPRGDRGDRGPRDDRRPPARPRTPRPEGRGGGE